MMFTTDLALRLDPIYAPIAKRFHENPAQFAEAFAKAWYKLTPATWGPSRGSSARWSPRRSCGRTLSRPSITN
jgi:catalase-peroxidase